MTTLAPVIFLDPDAAQCGCAGRCVGHQPTPAKTDRRTGYREAADLLDTAGEPKAFATPIAELLRACADLCLPVDHPSRPSAHTTVASLLAAADRLANAVLPDDAPEDETEAEAGNA